MYDRRVDGQTLTFGVSGKLADDALVMYDRETESEWKQPTGVAIAGALEGERLTALAAPVVIWARFRVDNPDGVVLQPVRAGDGESARPEDVYDMVPYEQYVDREAFGLYGMRGEGEPRSWDRDDLDPKTVVLGVEHDGDALAFPVPRVEANGGVATATVGELDVVAFASDGGIHAFENPGHEFEVRDGRPYADGSIWDPVTGRSDDGRRLDRVAGRRLFTFAWQDAHGADAFYTK